MKNLKNKYLIAISVSMLMLFSSCNDFLDINDNPNNPPIVSVDGLLANVTYYTGTNVYSLGATTSYYVQYLASPNQASSTDVQERVDMSGSWSNYYSTLTDLADLRKLAEEQNRPTYLAIADILTSLHMGLVIDVWNDVPFSEAFFGETLNPSYDDAQTLYQEVVLGLLDDAISIINAGNFSGTPGGDDFINNGDMDSWLKTAHALKARYLNHYSATNSYDAEAVLAEIDAAFTSNFDDATVTGYVDESGKRNPWGQIAINNADLLLGGWLSEQIIQALDGTTYGFADPRIEAYTDTVDAGGYVGTVNGAGRGAAKEQGERCVLTTDTYFAQRTGPLEIITYAEIKFIEAEAALRGGYPTRAYQAYLDGIAAHMEKLGVEQAESDAYINNPVISVGAGALSLDDIFREKYKIMFLNPEAWVDARRYNYQYKDMTLPEYHNTALNGQFIQRLDYPDVEYSRNRSQMPDLANPLAEPIWWDQN